jgi:hypothetical protein
LAGQAVELDLVDQEALADQVVADAAVEAALAAVADKAAARLSKSPDKRAVAHSVGADRALALKVVGSAAFKVARVAVAEADFLAHRAELVADHSAATCKMAACRISAYLAR